MQQFSWSDPDWMAFMLGVVFSTLGFTVYYFLNHSPRLIQYFFSGDPVENVRKILFQRLSGALIFGIMPAFIFLLANPGGSIRAYTGSLNVITFWWFIPLAALLTVGNYFTTGSPENRKMYPEIRKRAWSSSLVVVSAISWIAYLFAYEFVFRALLFTAALSLFGFWPAVMLNIGVYSLVHVPKGSREGIGSIVLGFVMCSLVFHTGSFWIAFFLHVVLALSNEWFSIRYLRIQT